MDRLINELTFYSKIDTNRIPYTFDKINVKDYFEDCVEELSAWSWRQQQISSLSLCSTMVARGRAWSSRTRSRLSVSSIISSGNSMKYMDKPKG